MAHAVKAFASLALLAQRAEALSLVHSRVTQHAVDNFDANLLDMLNADYSNVETQSCEVWADPHVSGFDNTENQGPSSLALLQNAKKALQRTAVGMSSFLGRPVDVNAYESGDFWLVKSEPIYIQGRFRLSGEFKPDRAAIGAVAIGGPFLKNHKLIIEPLDGQVSFDGNKLEDGVFQLTKNGGSDIVLKVNQDGHGGVEAQLPMNVKLLFRRMAKHVDVKITMPKINGGVDGECGNQDGIAENDDEETVESRMGAMMVDDNMLLFPKGAKGNNGQPDRMVDSEGIARGEGFSNVKQQAKAEAMAQAEGKRQAIAQAKADRMAEKQARAEAAALAKAEAAKARGDAQAEKLARAEAAAAKAEAIAQAKVAAMAEKQARAVAAAMAKAEAAAEAKDEAEAKAEADREAKAEKKDEADAKAEADREAKAEKKAEVIAAAEARKDAAEEAKAEQKAALEAAAEKIAEEKARAEAKAEHERELAAKKQEIAAARAAHQEEKAARLEAAMKAKEEARAEAAEVEKRRAAKRLEIAAIKDAHQQDIAAKMEAAMQAKEDARAEYAANAQARKDEIAAKMEAAAEERAQAAAAKEEAKDEAEAKAEADREAKAEKKAEVIAAAEARKDAADEAKDQRRQEVAAEHQANADARNEMHAAKQDSRDETLHKSKQTQSCEVWADPHVSGFDNADNQGPESLALMAFAHSRGALRYEREALMAFAGSRGRFNYGGAGAGDIAGSSGVSTFDKRPVDLNAYDTGDFWLVKSDPVHIQGRFRLSGEFIPDKAAIGAIAVGGPFMQGHKLIVEPLDGTISFDGNVAPIGSWSHQTADGQEELISLMDDGHGSILAELPMGVSLFLRRMDKHVDIKITMPELEGGIDGECGNYDGIAENDVENDIKDRMGNLMIEHNKVLFDVPFEFS